MRSGWTFRCGSRVLFAVIRGGWSKPMQRLGPAQHDRVALTQELFQFSTLPVRKLLFSGKQLLSPRLLLW